MNHDHINTLSADSILPSPTPPPPQSTNHSSLNYVNETVFLHSLWFLFNYKSSMKSFFNISLQIQTDHFTFHFCWWGSCIATEFNSTNENNKGGQTNGLICYHWRPTFPLPPPPPLVKTHTSIPLVIGYDVLISSCMGVSLLPARTLNIVVLVSQKGNLCSHSYQPCKIVRGTKLQSQQWL